jgi:hypothetical protein
VAVNWGVLGRKRNGIESCLRKSARASGMGMSKAAIVILEREWRRERGFLVHVQIGPKVMTMNTDEKMTDEEVMAMAEHLAEK